jgi:outer membrane protein
MRKFTIAATLLLLAAPLFAQQRRLDLFFDLEGVRRTGRNTQFTPNVVRLDPTFSTGGGIGGGVDWFFTNRLSLEAKVAAMAAHVHLRAIGSDTVAVADLGYAQIYPISVLLQWHMSEHGAIRPYLGAGAAHIILRNVSRRIGSSTTATAIHFEDPNGLVLDGGLTLTLGRRWNLYGDVRYIPIETRSRATFPGTASAANISVRPVIVSAGLSYGF